MVFFGLSPSLSSLLPRPPAFLTAAAAATSSSSSSAAVSSLAAALSSAAKQEPIGGISRVIGIDRDFHYKLLTLLDFGYKCHLRLPLFISALFVLCKVFSNFVPRVEINVEVVDPQEPPRQQGQGDFVEEEEEGEEDDDDSLEEEDEDEDNAFQFHVGLYYA